MTEKNATYRFPLIDVTGEVLREPGLWGTIGFREYYDGELSDTDTLVQSLRRIHSGENLKPDEALTVRSFVIAWLTSYQKDLSKVIDYAIPLSDSVKDVARIGMLDRTVNTITAGVATAAATVLFLELAWEHAAFDALDASVAETCSFIVSQIDMEIELNERLHEVCEKLDTSIGRPGEPTDRAAFQADAVFDFLKMCSLRSALKHAQFDSVVRTKVQRRIDHRIFALFLANSRQIEGLMLAGASEASAAIVAHTGLAVGLHEHNDRDDLLKSIDDNIQLLGDEVRTAEATQTFGAIRSNLSGRTADLERRISRYVNSANTTEAIDLATLPITSTLELMSAIAHGLGDFTSTSKAGAFLKIAGSGIDMAQSIVDSTPNAASHVIESGVSAEEWTRKLLRRVWEGKQAAQEPATANDQELPVDSQKD